MSRRNAALDDRADALPLADLLTTLAVLGVEFRRGSGESLALKGGSVLTGELREAIAEHKPALLEIADIRAEFSRLYERIIHLRCQDPAQGTREDALRRLEARINRHCDQLGNAAGYYDPSDPWADDALLGLREAYDELTADGNPYPLGPLTDDPFSTDPPRFYSGKLIPFQ